MDESGFFWPVYLIIVGVAILFINLGVLPAQLWRFWPLILIIPGLIKLSTFGSSEGKKK